MESGENVKSFHLNSEEKRRPWKLWQKSQRQTNKNIFFIFSTKTYVVGTQNNSLNEMVLLNTIKTSFNCIMGKKKNHTFDKKRITNLSNTNSLIILIWKNYVWF